LVFLLPLFLRPPLPLPRLQNIPSARFLRFLSHPSQHLVSLLGLFPFCAPLPAIFSGPSTLIIDCIDDKPSSLFFPFSSIRLTRSSREPVGGFPLFAVPPCFSFLNVDVFQTTACLSSRCGPATLKPNPEPFFP